MRLSVLDQSPVSEGSTGAQALHNTLDLARLADRLGYHRYWVAEHHGTPMLASTSPEVLIGPVASATERIRVGSGGVMLPHYSPFKVAEAFSVLAGLYPGRIDLGLGRAPGTDLATSHALQRDRRQAAPDDFPQQLAELLAYLEDALPENHPFARLTALPGLPERPEVWMLGSSPQSAIWAGELGLPYSFADFINPGGAEIAALYRDKFAPGERLPAPRARGVRLGDLRRHRRGGRAPGRQQPHEHVDAAPGPADPRPARGQGAALPGVARPAVHAVGPARRDRRPGGGARRASSRWPATTARRR